MWMSDRMAGLLLFLSALITAFFAWQANDYVFTPRQLISFIPLSSVGVYFFFRAYPININGLHGVNEERAKIYELIDKFDKWLEENPEEK